MHAPRMSMTGCMKGTCPVVMVQLNSLNKLGAMRNQTIKVNKTSKLNYVSVPPDHLKILIVCSHQAVHLICTKFDIIHHGRHNFV